MFRNAWGQRRLEDLRIVQTLQQNNTKIKMHNLHKNIISIQVNENRIREGKIDTTTKNICRCNSCGL